MTKLIQTLRSTCISKQTLLTVFSTLVVSLGALLSGLQVEAYFSGEIRNLEQGQRRLSLSDRRSFVMARHSAAPDDFPSFECAIMPFGFVPHWGNMLSAQDLQRNFCSIDPGEFVPIPTYDIATLTRPMDELNRVQRTDAVSNAITAKLFYSTRFMGSYDLDSAEFSNPQHPAMDFKMPFGTPIRAVAGGIVHALQKQQNGLGNLVIIEHRLPDTQERVFSIYGHMDMRLVGTGESVEAGQVIGTVGNSGRSTNPHLHLQIDKDRGHEFHTPYTASANTTRDDVLKWTMHPMDFINTF